MKCQKVKLKANCDKNRAKSIKYVSCTSVPFLSMFFSITTQHFLNTGKKKQPFRSNSTAFIIASRTVYAGIRCEQTTAFELLKLLQ